MSTQWNAPETKNGRVQAPIRPDSARLVEDTDAAIVPGNVRALEILYFAVMLEEARLFQVVERLVALFSEGSLPVGSGPATEILYQYWKTNHHRLTAAERQIVYARAFGFPTDEASVSPNREFNDLWLRFLPTVGMYAAELQLPPAERSVNQEEIRRSGRELAANLSAHGYGITWSAAQELKLEIQGLIRLLSDAEITNAFGATDSWQVIERVATAELGGRPNIPRGRTRAESGRIIIRWLANHHKLLLRPVPTRILKDNHILQQRSAASEEKKRSHPTDYDLVIACGQWLAVTGTQEAQLEE